MKTPLFIVCVLLSSRLAAQPVEVLNVYAPNPHYLAYKGKPIILMGSGEHYGAVVNLDFDYKSYLQSSAAERMNTTRLFMGSYVEKLGNFNIQRNTLATQTGRMVLPWQRSNEIGYALGGNKFDLNTWDERYFTRLADFMKQAREQGIIVEANLFSAYYENGWQYSPFNPANNINRTDSIGSKAVNTLQNGNILVHQERYVRELVRRLNGFGNFYFEIQNEPWAGQTDVARMHNPYGPPADWRSTVQVVSQPSNEWQREVAGWITSEEKKLPHKHLISQNISNFHYPITNSDPQVSLFTFHYASPDAVRENWYLNKPIGFNETGFAGSADSTYRRQAWRFLLNGGALFNQLDYTYSVRSPTGRDSIGTSPGGGGVALRQQFRVLHNFLGKINVTQLQPDYAVVRAAPGQMTWAMSDGKSRWVVYCESLATGSYPLTLALPSGTYTAEWIDTQSGRTIQKATISGGTVPSPAGLADRVVVIQKSR